MQHIRFLIVVCPIQNRQCFWGVFFFLSRCCLSRLSSAPDKWDSATNPHPLVHLSLFLAGLWFEAYSRRSSSKSPTNSSTFCDGLRFDAAAVCRHRPALSKPPLCWHSLLYKCNNMDAHSRLCRTFVCLWKRPVRSPAKSPLAVQSRGAIAMLHGKTQGQQCRRIGVTLASRNERATNRSSSWL